MKIKAISICALLATILLVPMISSALADSPQVRKYSASITPISASAGQTQTYTITITANTSNTQLFGSATITIPSGFTSVSLSAAPNPVTSNGKTWVAAIYSGLIQLAASGGTNKLAAGASVSVSFSATAPSPATDTDYEWTTTVYQDVNTVGAAFTLTGTPYTIVGDQPVVTVMAAATSYTHEGAFAYDDDLSIPFTDFGFEKWGWTNGPLEEGTYSFQLVAGAGNDVLDHGTEVGTVSVTYSSGSLSWAITMTGGNVLDNPDGDVIVQVYAGTNQLPQFNGADTVSPGHYGNQYTGSMATSASGTITGLSGSVYLIIHAEVGIPVT